MYCAGVVELREDVPLKAGAAGAGAGRWCAGGPRVVLASFAVLTVAITVALLTQIYYGDYQVDHLVTIIIHYVRMKTNARKVLFRAGSRSPEGRKIISTSKFLV